ncbi:MAG: hypothetical protein JO257_27570 [Deltaproteobacteria bacterium]|nr:hypothetical protein [Deltaproteobacteria bacterium]
MASGAVVVACGGSDSKNGPDAKVFLDGHGGGSGSGSGSGSNNVTGLGQHCTQGSGAFDQGSCPGGYVCLNLNGGHDTWCSKACTAGSADTCNTGYTGPGEGACVYRISAGSGSGAQTMQLCGIVCALQGSGCPNCNDTCPGTLQCSATLTSGSGAAVGSACL